MAIWIILIPIISAPLAGILGKIWEKLRDYFSTLSILFTFLISFFTFIHILKEPVYYRSPIFLTLHLDPLGVLMASFISFLGFLATLYSLSYMKQYKKLNKYYTFLLLFIGSMNGAVLAGDLFTMFLFWEFMTLSAFFLVIFENSNESLKAGIKYFIMCEAGALCMLLAIISIFQTNGTLNMTKLSLGSNNMLLLLFLIGLGVKAGMVPLHTWLPEAHPIAPSPISALLSGIMIKVGIYMMIRIYWQIFAQVISWQFVLMLLGSISILIGGIMALVQKDSKRLLAFSSISQIGYMILGIGIGTTIGIAGGLFHLMNHVFFKGLLFLCIGAVLYRTKIRDLSKLGGLANQMPITFITCSIAALSISGVPPFNGFVSKWMIYQAIIERCQMPGAGYQIIFLIAAMFGSALTLAYFAKLIHSIFLSEKPKGLSSVREVGVSMGFPLLVLAFGCIFFGVFAKFPLQYMIAPVVGRAFLSKITHFGIWQPGLATVLLLVSLLVGLILYLLGRVKTLKEGEVFLGGERIEPEEIRIPGTHFYGPIKSIGFLKKMYARAEQGFFDLYIQGKKIIFILTNIFRKAHSGILTIYLLWCLFGLAILFFLLRIQ
ncbi:MAG: complex I subunit 5 family protein [bacterium]